MSAFSVSIFERHRASVLLRLETFKKGGQIQSCVYHLKCPSLPRLKIQSRQNDKSLIFETGSDLIKIKTNLLKIFIICYLIWKFHKNWLIKNVDICEKPEMTHKRCFESGHFGLCVHVCEMSLRQRTVILRTKKTQCSDNLNVFLRRLYKAALLSCVYN